MTARDIAHCRLINQQIAGAKCERTARDHEAARRSAGPRLSRALWAIGLRSVSSTEADIEKAIETRTIIRTWPIRGTLHLWRQRTLAWMLETT